MKNHDWTSADKLFLKSLRIRSSDPPPPLPRYRVEQGKFDGWYRVVDTERKFKSRFEVGPKEFTDPRAAAEDIALQLNSSTVKEAE